MSYSIKIFGDKNTPDYVYWKFSNLDELNTIKKLLLSNINGWIQPGEEGQRYVNPRCVSSIWIDKFKNRVIFNMNYPISLPKQPEKLTSDFVFFDFSTKDKFIDYIDTLDNMLSKLT